MQTGAGRRGVHPMLWILLCVWPLLVARGVYGVLSPVVPAFNYFSVSNYDENGLKNAFVVSEYLLGTTTEWTSCALLMLTYVTSRNDPKRADFEKKEPGREGAALAHC